MGFPGPDLAMLGALFGSGVGPFGAFSEPGNYSINRYVGYDSTGGDSTCCASAGYASAGYEGAGCVSTGCDSTGCVSTSCASTGCDRAGWVSTGCDSTGCVSTSCASTDYDSAGCVSTGSPALKYVGEGAGGGEGQLPGGGPQEVQGVDLEEGGVPAERDSA